MAIDAGHTKVYARGVDLSTTLQNTTIEQSCEEVDVTAYANTARVMLPTLMRVSLAHAGIYVDGANTIGEAFRQARAAAAEPFTVFPEGTNVGAKALIVLAHKASITMPEAVAPGAVHKVSLRASSQQQVGDGVVEYAGAVSSDSQSAGTQLGALAAGETLLATIHILGVTTTPSVVFYLESDDGSGFPSATVRATSVAQTDRGSVLLQIAGAITDDWWRVRWDHSGVGSFTVVIALGIAG